MCRTEARRECRFRQGLRHFAHLFELTQRGVFWVTRAKDNLSFRVRRKLKADRSKGIVRDQIIEPQKGKEQAAFLIFMRRVLDRVEVDGKMHTVAFLTNDFDWAASSVAGPYQARRAIEVIFKQINPYHRANPSPSRPLRLTHMR